MFAFRVSCSFVALVALLCAAFYMRAARPAVLPPSPPIVSADAPRAMPALVLPADCSLVPLRTLP